MPGTWRKRGKIHGISRLLSASDDHRPEDEGDDDSGSGAGPRGSKKPPRWLLPPVPGASGFSTMASLASRIVAVSASASSSSWLTPAYSPPDTAEEYTANQQQRKGQADDDDVESFIEADMLAKNILYGLPPSKLPEEEVFNVLRGQKVPSGDVLQAFRVSECDALKGFDEPTATKGEAFESFSGSGMIKDGPPQPKAPVNEAPESSAIGVAEAEEKKVLEAEKRAFMVVAKVLFFMVILVMCTKKIAIGISISALAALFIEAIGKRLLSSERPCKEEEKSVEVVEGDVVPVSDLVQVPDALDSSSCERIPIELRENCGLDSGSEGGCEPKDPLEESSPGEEALGPALEPALEPEEWNPVEARGGQCVQRGPRRKAGKTKRLLRRIVRRGSSASSVESEEMEEKGARAA